MMVAYIPAVIGVFAAVVSALFTYRSSVRSAQAQERRDLMAAQGAEMLRLRETVNELDTKVRLLTSYQYLLWHTMASNQIAIPPLPAGLVPTDAI